MKKSTIKLLMLGAVTVASFSLLAACGEDKHNLTLIPEKAATCTEEGHTAYYACSHCDLIFADELGKEQIELEQVTTDPLGHNLSEGHHEAVAAECDAPGNIEYWECARCGKLFTDSQGENETESVTTTKAHTLKAVEKVNPTADSYGIEAHWECEVCEGIFADSYGDREVTEEELRIDKLKENIDGDLSSFYKQEKAYAFGAANVKEGGLGVALNAVRSEDGVYMHFTVNHNVSVKEQAEGHGKLGLIMDVRNDNSVNLPGNLIECMGSAMVSELYLNGNIAYNSPFDIFFSESKTNASGSLTKYTTVIETFISYEQLSKINGGVFAEAFEEIEGKIVMKDDYALLVNCIGNMTFDESEQFANENGNLCENMENGTWLMWRKDGYGDSGINQKMMVLGANGFSDEHLPIVDRYELKTVEQDNVVYEGFSDEILTDGVIEGKIKADDGFKAVGVIINEVLYLADKEGNIRIEVSELNLLWSTKSIEMTAVIAKSSEAVLTLSLKDLKGNPLDVADYAGKTVTFSTDGYTYELLIKQDGTLEGNVFAEEYTVAFYGFKSIDVTIPESGNLSIELTATTAHTSNDSVKADSDGTITIDAKSKDVYNHWTGSAEYVLSEELRSEKNFILEMTLKMGDVEEGFTTHSTQQRYAIQLTDSGKGFCCWSYRNEGVSKTVVRELISLEDCMAEGSLVHADGAEASFGWIYDALVGEGAQIRVVRLEDELTLYILNGEKWEKVGSVSCGAEDGTKIVFYGVTSSFEFSEISVEALGEFVEAKDPTVSENGCIAHWVNGDKYYFENGLPATFEDITLDKFQELKNVEITLTDMDGNALAEGSKVYFSSDWLSEESDPLIVGKDGSVILPIGYTIEYTVSVEGYKDIEFMLTESGGGVNY